MVEGKRLQEELMRVSCDWSRFTLNAVSQLGLSLRHIAVERESVWDRAQAITRVLFDAFRGEDPCEPLCPLVRVFRTVPVTRLSDEDQADLRRREAVSGGGCGPIALQLIGTYGIFPGWCDRTSSSRYRCVSVNAMTFPGQYPMLSALLRRVQADADSAGGVPIGMGSEEEGELAGGLRMFYVSDARNNPFIPAQADFVERYHIRSVLGFGGQFRDGEYFCVVLFSRAVIPQSVLPLMRILSLNIRLGLERNGMSERCLEPCRDGSVAGHVVNSGDEGFTRRGECDAETFEQLVGLYERTVMQQDTRLQEELLRVVDQQRVIEEHAARVQALNRQLLVAAEEERRALSRDLHDIVATQLGGMIFQMQAVLDVPGEGREELLGWIRQYRHELLEVVQRTRELSFALHPSSLERAGVVGALERVLREAGRRQQWFVESHCDESVERVLTYEESVCVYRVAQEAIHNCEKHAQATRVVMRLEVCAGDLVLRVIDNGRGFVVAKDGCEAVVGGLGHMGMAERASLINAKLQIESSAILGTRVSLYINDGGRLHREGIAC